MKHHIPVMLEESVHLFQGKRISLFFDGTLGSGGFARALLDAHPEIDRYFGCDWDRDVFPIAEEATSKWKDKLVFLPGNFADVRAYLDERGVDRIDGCFFDLGLSSMQLDRGERGFSFLKEGPLDMRMDPSSQLTAGEIVNSWSERALGAIFREWGEEPRWKSIARRVVDARRKKRIETTTELASIISQGPKSRKRLHAATLTFQALRICVNRELDAIRRGLPAAISRLRVGGRIGVISFHRLEDRIVKNLFRKASRPDLQSDRTAGDMRDSPSLMLLAKKPLTPTLEERKNNPRARSAKLRIAEKL